MRNINPTRRTYLLWIPVLFGVISLGSWAFGQAREVFTKLKVIQTIMLMSRQMYVDTVDVSDLLDGAIDGLLDRLDPHSNYITPEETAKLREKMTSRFFGVGIEYTILNGVITVISPIEGAPAKIAGVETGDKIVAVDGVVAVGWRQDEVQKHIRGPAGTRVVLTIRRGSLVDLIEIAVTRGQVPVRSVRSAFMLDDEIGYMRVTRFAKTTGREVAVAWDSLGEEGMKSLILDLRDNGGGDLGAAVAISDMFLPEGTVIVSQKGRWVGATQTFYATSATREMIPVVILINHGSASASEIVAGAVQDTDRGLIVGLTSFGKGLVQGQFDVSKHVRGAGSLLLTIARYYTPSGRLIQRSYGENKQQYYMEAYRDGPIDTTKREAFRTLNLGRTVYGGGGITPDVVSHPRRVESLERRLSRQRAFFSFADKLASTGRDVDHKTAFHPDFQIDPEIMDQFRDFADQLGVEIDSASWQDDAGTLAARLKEGIAMRRWGTDAADAVRIAVDPMVLEAKARMADAEELMAQKHTGY